MDSVIDSSSLDALWDFYDPEESEGRFRRFLEQPLPAELRAETLTQIARTLGLQKRFAEANATLDEAEAIAHPRSRAEVRLLLEKGRVLNSSGDRITARTEFISAWGMARAIGQDELAVDAAHMVAITHDPAGQLEWNGRALDLARTSEDPMARKWIPSLLNNLAWTLHDQGEFGKALELFQEARTLRAEGGEEIEERIARWCIARCLRSLGRYDEALLMQRRILEEQAGKGPGYAEEEIGECLAALDRLDEARPFLQTAFQKLSANGEIAGQPDRLARLGEMAGALPM